jgi:hypothetical protein
MFERRIFTSRRAATRGATAIFFAFALGAHAALTRSRSRASAKRR